MILFLITKILILTAIFSKAWLDVKGNKNQLDHVVTCLFEASLIFIVVILYYYDYASPIHAKGYMIIPSYLLIRYAFFDMFWNRLAVVRKYHLGSNNWLDRVKKWMLKIELKHRFPLLTISRFVAGFFGLLM
jgi:hypothetical protein